MLCTLTGLVFIWCIYLSKRKYSYTYNLCIALQIHYSSKTFISTNGGKISILIVSECKHLHQCSETVFKLLIACMLFSDPSSEDTEMEMFTFPHQPETLKQSVPGSTPLFGLSIPPQSKRVYMVLSGLYLTAAWSLGWGGGFSVTKETVLL